MAEAAPDAIADAKAAVHFLRRHAAQLHVDGTRIAAWGNSAGGYLVAMLAVTADEPSEAIQAAVIWFGAEDRLGRELNPATYVAHARRIPPVRIVNGDADPVVSAAQARRLHEALMRSGARSELVILAGAGHEDPQFSRTQMQPTLAFLASALRR
jgi:acetyl esterase/lipase